MLYRSPTGAPLPDDRLAMNFCPALEGTSPSTNRTDRFTNALGAREPGARKRKQEVPIIAHNGRFRHQL